MNSLFSKMALILCTFIPLAQASEESKTKIAVVSCNDQNDRQNYWKLIAEQEPDLLIWLGDIVYADSAYKKNDFDLSDRKKEFMKLLEGEYGEEIVRRNILVTGIWDDHDYAADGKGRDAYPDEVKIELANFLQKDFLTRQPPLNSEAPWLKGRVGIYHERLLLTDDQKTIAIINLDTRSFKDLSDRQLLGEAQRQWLTQRLTHRPDVDLFIINSSISVSATLNIRNNSEGWQQYKEDLELLKKLLANLPQPVVIFTGDRHMAEVSVLKVGGVKGEVIEIMSSGLNKASPFPNRSNANRLGGIFSNHVYQKDHFAMTSFRWLENKLEFEVDIYHSNPEHKHSRNSALHCHFTYIPGEASDFHDNDCQRWVVAGQGY